MTYDEIRFEVADGIGTVTLHRPDKLNAFTVRMLQELLHVFDRIDADDAVKAVIVTGAGKAFCAGADLAAAGANTFDYTAASPEASAFRDGGGLLTLRMFESKKPLIAAVNGVSVGVGATLMLPMDVRIAATGARFGFVFARRGIPCDAASSWFLPRVVGISQASEWVCTGRIFPAEEALAARLVSRVVPPEQLLDTARTIAREIVDNVSPVAATLCRGLLWHMLGAAHPMEAHRAESELILAMGRSADALEGVTSFLQKRPPAFPMRPSTDLPDVASWWTPPRFK